MRSLRHSSKKRSLRTLPDAVPQVSDQTEQRPEPLGHVHNNYRHWVWLGLHHSDR